MASPGDIPNPVETTTKGIGGHKNAEFATKVIEILNGAGYQKHIALVLNEGVTDYWLPIPKRTIMPAKLLDYITFEAFKNAQSPVLEKSYELNRSHIPLDAQATYEWNGVRYPKSLIYKRYLGEGGAGIVVEMQVAGGTTYAVKRIPRKAGYHEAKSQLRSIKQEIENLKKINHTHCIKFLGSYGDVEDIGVVMDPVADCNLDSFLSTFNRSEPNSGMVLASFFGCLANALVYLHKEVNIRHKDIKPENILVKKDRVILTDFGISLDWSEQGHSTTQEEANRSPKYCAPEAYILGQPRNQRSDIWSLGCVFLEMSAVLHGFSSGYVTTILKRHGCLYFRECPGGILDAISEVREQGASENNGSLELEWIEQMLRLENNKRWYSEDLQQAISQSRSEPPFCGICCNRAWPGALRTEPAQLHDSKLKKWHSVTVIRDNSVSGGWISKRLVDLYQLETHQMKQREILNVGGHQFETDKKADVTFVPDTTNHAEKANCRVITSAPFDLLIGNTNLRS
ncbi:unnamed protein product [Clonostachys rhizophaga]|uniref:Protein kinase domain-containing protein n=1 Tax=Clonostachys rhizophaga TaxID=160324 RepID=A0A9N9VIL2_9HYPO|nr:unnamed protein product [Clonostachys rhizophaga]